MSDEFLIFQQMKQKGETALSCVRLGRAGGLRFSAQIRMLREVFGLSLMEAKEVLVMCDGWGGLDEYQESLLPALRAALGQLATEQS